MPTFQEQLKEIINSGALADRASFATVLTELGIGQKKYELYPITIEEIVSELNEFLDFLLDSKNSKLIESSTVGFKRDLIAHLRALKGKAQQLFADKNVDEKGVIVPMLHQARMIGKLVTDQNLNLRSDHITNYRKKLSELTQIKKNATRLKTEYRNAEKQLEKGLDIIKDLEQKHSGAQEIKDELDGIRQVVNSIKTDLSSDQAEIAKLTNDIREFHNTNFSAKKAQFEDPVNGVDAVLKKAVKVSTEVEQLKVRTDEQYDKITSKVEGFSAKAEELNKISGDLQSLLASAQDKETGFESSLKHISSVKTSIDDSYDKIKNSIKVITEYEGRIETLEKKASQEFDSVVETKEGIIGIKRKIDEIYNVAAKQGMGSEFMEARDYFEEQRDFWLKAVIATIIILIVVAVVVSVLDLSSISEYKGLNLFLRYAILTPGIYGLIFCTRQFRSARLSHEKYAFKTVLTFSIAQHFREFKPSYESDKKEDFLLWALDKLNKLYDEPYFDEAMNMKYKIELDRLRFGVDEPQNNHDIED